jgi:hypothetical protein
MAFSIKGFDKTPPGAKSPRLIMNVQGWEKQGKSHYALTAPKPLAFLNLDDGLEGMVTKFTHPDILFASFFIRDAINWKQWDALWNKWFDAYSAALSHKDVRTVVVDTGTELWELLRLARFGKKAQVLPHEYGPVNDEFRRVLNLAKASDKNVIFTHKLKPLYVNDKRVSGADLAGFGDMRYVVQSNVEVMRNAKSGEFQLRVIDNRIKAELAGEVYSGIVASFPYFAAETYPHTSLEYWGA